MELELQCEQMASCLQVCHHSVNNITITSRADCSLIYNNHLMTFYACVSQYQNLSWIENFNINARAVRMAGGKDQEMRSKTHCQLRLQHQNQNDISSHTSAQLWIFLAFILGLLKLKETSIQMTKVGCQLICIISITPSVLCQIPFLLQPSKNVTWLQTGTELPPPHIPCPEFSLTYKYLHVNQTWQSFVSSMLMTITTHCITFTEILDSHNFLQPTWLTSVVHHNFHKF